MTSSLAVPYVSPMGAQQPRISSVPPYASSSGAEAVELTRVAGIELDPWQQMELTHGLGESADWKCPHCTHRSADPMRCPAHPLANLIHPWAAFEVTQVVPRQNGKSELLIARILAGLFILEEPLQIFSAHEFDTALEVMRRLAFVVENCDDLRREVKHRGSQMVGIKYGNGAVGIELESGLRVRFKARTGGGGRGFSCDCLYLDEAMILQERFLGSTVPTLSARANPQIWLAGSPPDEQDPTHDGVVLAKRRERALAGNDPSLAYFEYSADFDGDPGRVPASVLDDPDQRRLANPGLGIRITSEIVQQERAAMGSRQFAVERMGIGAWPNTSDDAERVITLESWRAAAEHDPEGRIVSPPVFAVDCNVDQTWASVAVAGKRDDGKIQFAVVEHARGTDWIVPFLMDLKTQHKGCKVAIDRRGPAAEKIDDLKRERVRLIEMSTEDYVRACGGFFSGVTEDRFRYPSPQPELDEALSDARKASLGDGWKWSRRSSTSADISPLVACTLAAWAAEGAAGRPRVINLAEALASA
jgi:hypothetical protein